MPVYRVPDLIGEDIDLKQAKGFISTDYISLYPPGIPILVPGEEISQEHIEGITEAIRGNLKVQGLTKDGRIRILTGTNREY